MHLLLIHQAFVSTQEAGGTRHIELARHLIKNGHRVTVIASQVSYLTGQRSNLGGSPQFIIKDKVEGIDIRRVYAYGKLHQSFISRVLSFISFMLSAIVAAWQVREVELVMGTSPPIFQGVSALVVAWLKRLPFVFEVRDLWPDFAVDMGVLRNPALIALARWLEKFLYTQAKLIIVNSPAYVTHVERKGILVRRIAFVPNGVDVSMFNPTADGASLRAELGLIDKFIVLYAGAHGQANDLITLLKAAHQLQVQGANDIVLVLMGDGKEKPNLVAYSRDLGLTNVRFIDAQPKARMPEFLAAANACVAILQNIPMFTTTYPNKVFDYMAAGRPTVLAIDGVIREVIERGQAGIFVPPGNVDALTQALRQLAADPARCTQMGLNGRRYVEQHFDRAQQAQQFEQVLTTLANHVSSK